MPIVEGNYIANRYNSTRGLHGFRTDRHRLCRACGISFRAAALSEVQRNQGGGSRADAATASGAARDPGGRSRRGDGRICGAAPDREAARSDEHTSELQSLMRSSYAVFCLKKKN